jgi:predicted aminopeptidase
LAAWSRHDAWVETFSAWLKMHRENLQAIYQSDIDDHHKRKQKQAYLASMQQLYHDFRQQHQGDSSFDRWMQQPLNNARLLSIGSYNDWVVAFRHLMGQQACRWPAFYRAAEDLAALQPEQRTQALQTLQREHSYGDCSQRDADVVQKDW